MPLCWSFCKINPLENIKQNLKKISNLCWHIELEIYEEPISTNLQSDLLIISEDKTMQ